MVKAAGAQFGQPYHPHVPIVLKSGSLNLLEASGPVQGWLYFYLLLAISLTFATTSFELLRTSHEHIFNSLTEKHSIYLPSVGTTAKEVGVLLQPTEVSCEHHIHDVIWWVNDVKIPVLYFSVSFGKQQQMFRVAVLPPPSASKLGLLRP